VTAAAIASADAAGALSGGTGCLTVAGTARSNPDNLVGVPKAQQRDEGRPDHRCSGVSQAASIGRFARPALLTLLNGAPFDGLHTITRTNPRRGLICRRFRRTPAGT
jgi:hypothetical protein